MDKVGRARIDATLEAVVKDVAFQVAKAGLCLFVCGGGAAIYAANRWSEEAATVVLVILLAWATFLLGHVCGVDQLVHALWRKIDEEGEDGEDRPRG